jgi:DNA-binding phage protein
MELASTSLIEDRVTGFTLQKTVTSSSFFLAVVPSVDSNGTSIKPKNYWPSTRPEKKQCFPIQPASTRVNLMALTRNFKETVIERVQSDATFAQALLDEAATLFLNGEPETARLILRDLVNATIGFEQLAALTAKPSKSLHRMLSPTGNPSMDNLAAIFRAVRERLQVSLSAHSVAA